MEAQDMEKLGAQTQEAMEIVFSFVPVLVLKAAVLLDIPEMIARQGPNASLSLHQIAARLPTKTPHLDYLSRILRYLSTKGIFLQSRVGNEDQYALTDLAKFFFLKENNPSTLLPLVMLETNEIIMARWHHLHERVLEGSHPFEKAHGKHIYDCRKDDPHFNTVLNDFMGFSTMATIGQIANCYEGFKELKSIVDVGGAKGTAVGEIVKAFPHIRGINFDLPHAVADAPPIPGVEHVGGSMFDSIPSADAIFLKNVLVDWDDESCTKVLKNSYEALPENGKLILVEELVADELGESALFDIVMMTPLAALRVRSEQEWSRLLKSTSFSIVKILRLPGMFTKTVIIEAAKLNAM